MTIDFSVATVTGERRFGDMHTNVFNEFLAEVITIFWDTLTTKMAAFNESAEFCNIAGFTENTTIFGIVKRIRLLANAVFFHFFGNGGWIL
jgi:hypothetical protein